MWKTGTPAGTENAKCKDCHKIGHFHKVCQTKKRAKQRANLVQTPQDDDDTHIDGNGVRQPNPPRIDMFKLVNHVEANKGGKHLKFSIPSHPKGPYKHHIVVRVDTGADVNCMNEKTFNELFPKVQLSVCPHEIQNFRNSVADISVLGQFHTYLEFRGSQTRRCISLEKSPAPTQWKDFCEQTPIDEAGHTFTLFWLL